MEDIACRSPEDLNTIFTIDHSNRTLAEFMSLIKDSVICRRRTLDPALKDESSVYLDVLPQALAAAELATDYLLALGGRRLVLRA